MCIRDRLWTVWRRVSRKSPCCPPAVSRDSLGKITLVIDRIKVPAITRYRLVEYSIADTPAPPYSREPNRELMTRLMGWTQVDTITGPISANTFFIPGDRKSNPGRYW